MTGNVRGNSAQDRDQRRMLGGRNAFGDLAAQFARGGPACSRPTDPRHRETDWRRGEGPWTCGICHPPADPDWLDLERRPA